MTGQLVKLNLNSHRVDHLVTCPLEGNLLYLGSKLPPLLKHSIQNFLTIFLIFFKSKKLAEENQNFTISLFKGCYEKRRKASTEVQHVYSNRKNCTCQEGDVAWLHSSAGWLLKSIYDSSGKQLNSTTVAKLPSSNICLLAYTLPLINWPNGLD